MNPPGDGAQEVCPDCGWEGPDVWEPAVLKAMPLLEHYDPGGGVDLRGASANNRWHIPLYNSWTLGALEAARQSVERAMDDLRVDVDRVNPALPGICMASIVMTSWAVELGLKTLIAVSYAGTSQPEKAPPHSHKLHRLWMEVAPWLRSRCEMRYARLPIHVEMCEDLTLEGVLKVCSNNFIQWRYPFSVPVAGDGMPGPLLRAATAVVFTGLDLCRHGPRNPHPPASSTGGCG